MLVPVLPHIQEGEPHISMESAEASFHAEPLFLTGRFVDPTGLLRYTITIIPFLKEQRKIMKKDKVLLVIDMQKDFVTGALANEEAQKIIGGLQAKIADYRSQELPVLFTRDTHGENYMETQEGRLLPVPHCIKGSEGWQIIEALRDGVSENDVLDKPTFGCMDLPKWLSDRTGGIPEEVELVGVCTDICVISNAMILKAAFPETTVKVDSGCCAGVSPQSHETALEAMKACQIIVA